MMSDYSRRVARPKFGLPTRDIEEGPDAADPQDWHRVHRPRRAGVVSVVNGRLTYRQALTLAGS